MVPFCTEPGFPLTATNGEADITQLLELMPRKAKCWQVPEASHLVWQSLKLDAVSQTKAASVSVSTGSAGAKMNEKKSDLRASQIGI